jgi:hypothetical protein
MVLRLKTRESRSLPGLQNATKIFSLHLLYGPCRHKGPLSKRPFVFGWLGPYDTRQIAQACVSEQIRKALQAFYADATIPKGFAQIGILPQAKTWTDDASVAWITRGGAAR